MNRFYKISVLFLTTISLFAQTPSKEAIKKVLNRDNQGAIEYFLKFTGDYPKSADGHYWLAYALFNDGKFDTALEEAKFAFELKPKFTDNRKLLLQIYLKKELYKEAFGECEFLMKESKKDLSFRMALSETYIGLNKYKEASDELSKLEVEKPNDRQVLTLLGDVYAKQRVNIEAIKYYNKALGIDANAIETKLKLAKLHFREQQYSEALKQYLDVVRLDSNSVDGNLYCGYIYFNAGKSNINEYGKAIFYLQKYVTLKPDDYQGFLFLGKSWHALRSWQNATDNLEKAIAKDDSSKIKEEANKLLSESYAGLGANYKRAGDTVNTINYYEKAFALNKELYSLFYDIGFMYYTGKNFNEAKKWFGKRVEVSPSDSMAATSWFLMGVCKYYSSKSRPDSLKATEDIKKSLELKANSNNYATLGGIFRSLDSTNQARWAYQQAILTDSTNSRAHSDLGVLIFNMPKGNVDEAITSFTQAIKFDEKGNSKATYYFLGLAYMKAKKMALAKETFKKYLEIDPNGPYKKGATDNINKIKP